MKFHSFIQDHDEWQTLGADQKFGNPHLKVFVEQVRTPARPQGCEWTVVHRKGAVVIAPLTADGRFLLVRQERVPIRESIWEFPAGQIEENGEHDLRAIHAAAARELKEESGYQLAPGGDFISLGYFFPSPGFTDEHSHLLLARPVVASEEGCSLDENEAITGSQLFTLDELKAMIARGEVKDANTLSAFARMSAMGLL